MDNKKFYSKVLLFGEYGVLLDSNALSIPFEKFYGYLNKSDFLNNEEKISNSNIPQLYEFMTDLDIKDKIDFNFFKNDIDKGLHFVSSIPIAIGILLTKCNPLSMSFLKKLKSILSLMSKSVINSYNWGILEFEIFSSLFKKSDLFK